MEDNISDYHIVLPTMKTMRWMLRMGIIGASMNVAVFVYAFLAGFHVIDETGARDAIAISSYILGSTLLFTAFCVSMRTKYIKK